MKRQSLSDYEWQCSRCGNTFIPCTKKRNQAIERGSQFVYCSRECLNARRLHPANEDLLFCVVCETYKPKSEYYKQVSNKYGRTPFCKVCHDEKQNEYFEASPDRYRETKRRYSRRYRDKMGKEAICEIQRKCYKNNRTARVKSSVEFIKRRRISDPEWCKKTRREYKEKMVKEVRDVYIRDLLRLEGLPPTPQNIEIKRDQIILLHEIKQLKQEVANGIT